MATPTAQPEPATQTSFDSAFQAAVVEHTPTVTAEPAVEQPSEPATQPPAVEQPAEEKGTEPTQQPEGSEEELLTSEEYDALKDNPKALRKALNRAYTQKTQRLAPYRRLIEALESNPKETVQLLARQYGLSAAEPEPAKLSDDTVTLLKQSLGPELEFLAEKLAPAFERIVDSAIGPVANNVQIQSALREVEAGMQAFSARHPDWQKAEPRMMELSRVFQPAVGPEGPLATQAEYLEQLYALATINQSSAESTKKVVERLTKSAQGAESPESGVAANRVAPRPSGIPTLDEAWAAAKAGVRWE